MFYVDFLGSPEDPRWRYAMNQLEEMTERLAVLGCYPQAT
jgi:prephenate dehydratase